MLGDVVIYLYDFGAGIVEVPAIIVEMTGDTATLYVLEKSGPFMRDGVERDDNNEVPRTGTWHPRAGA